jgi:cell division protein FtsB
MYKLLILTIVIAYFLYHSMTGQRGFLSTFDIHEKIFENNQKLEELQKERNLIEYKIKVLKSKITDYDLIDEIVRSKLRMADPKEIILIQGN